MLRLSGVVVDLPFTAGGVDVHGRLIVDLRSINAFINVLYFHGWSEPCHYFNGEIS